MDSVHALIEMTIRKKDPTHMVKYVNQTYFYSLISPGCTHGDAKVDIPQLQYTTHGVTYKLEHTGTYWRLPPQRLRDVHINLEMKKLQNNPLPKITWKWKNLQLVIIIIVSLNQLFPFLHTVLCSIILV